LAVKLRLRRIGKKKQPIYKVVAADSRSPRDGKFLESIGLYNPLTNPHTLDIKEDRALYWLEVGAQPTDTVASLLRQKGITLKLELKKKGLSEEKISEEIEKWSKLKEAKAKTVPKPKKSEAPKEKPVEETIINTAEVTGATSEENTASEEKAPQ
jgi:small subunit ribosomal protein S16